MSQQPHNALGEDEYYSAAALYTEGKVSEAESTLRQGIRNSPQHPWCHSLLGVILAERNLLDEAEKHLRIAAEAPSCDYTDPGIVRNLALFLLEKRRDPEQAEKIVRISLDQRQRKHSELFTVLGWILESQEQWRAARALYLEAIYRPPMPTQEGKWKDWNLGHWYARAVAGFQRTSAEYREEQVVEAPLRWRIGRWGPALSLVLLLAGTVSLRELPRLAWLPVLQWSTPMQIALATIGAVLWLLPYVLPYVRHVRLSVGPVSTEVELRPRMGT